LLLLLVAATAWIGYHASKVQLSYEFARAIPTDNPKYQIYQAFRKQFGEDGNLLVIGVQTDRFFKDDFFNSYGVLAEQVKKIPSVEDVLSIPGATNLARDSAAGKLKAVPVFAVAPLNQATLDSSAAVFLSLPFYRGLLYNPSTATWLMAVRIN